MLGEKILNAADPSATIQSEGGRWDKDVKMVRLSAEGAGIQITQLVLHWDNRKDDTMSVGTLQDGGKTAEFNAPGRKGRLTSVTVQYKILDNAQSATLRVWGFD